MTWTNRCQNGLHRTGRCPTCGESLTPDPVTRGGRARLASLTAPPAETPGHDAKPANDANQSVTAPAGTGTGEPLEAQIGQVLYDYCVPATFASKATARVMAVVQPALDAKDPDGVIKRLFSELDAANAALAAVRELHQRANYTGISGIVTCRECGLVWPCATSQCAASPNPEQGRTEQP